MSYINIQGKGLKFNQLAYIKFYEKVDHADFIGTFHYAAAFGGLRANAYVKGEEFTDSFENVCEWVDGLSGAEKEQITEVFNNTAYFKKLIEENLPEEVKAPEVKKKNSKNIMTTA